MQCDVQVKIENTTKENIKKFIDYIQGQFKTDIKELEQYDSYDSAKNYMFAKIWHRICIII